MRPAGYPQKILLVIILFYLFALLQNSFFTHFNLFGTVPNLVFIFFSLLVFFEKSGKWYEILFLAIIAGFFLDILSYTYIGPSIILLILIGFSLKKIKATLRNRDDGHPFVYFLPIFIIFLLAYDLLIGLYFHLLDPGKAVFTAGPEIISAIIYNTLAASLLFYIYKKCLKITA